MTTDDTNSTASSDDVSVVETDRRRFLQAAGVSVAGLTGLGGLAGAQGSGETHIELEAVTVETGGGRGRSEYAWEDGDGGVARGPPEAVCNIAGGNHVWVGVSPDSIAELTNPTLELIPGETYTVEWTNTDGEDHNFVIADADGTELVTSEPVSEEGATQTVEFEATEEMATYYCGPHSESQSGTISVGPAVEPTDEMLEVLYLGGVETAATHYTEDLLKELAPYLLRRGVRLHYTERQADLNAETLAHYDAVLLYGNRQDPTEAQIDALVEFVEDGGGFVPVHSASASFTSSDRFIDLVGGQFENHPEIQTTTTDRQQPDHPVFEGVDVFSSEEEPYRHQNVADDIDVLEYGAGADFGENEDEPWTWTRTQGDGRVFYTAWGHSSVWDTTGFKQLLHNALRWASGNEDTIGDHPMAPEKTYTNVSEYGHSEVPYYQGDAPDPVSSEDDGVWDLVQDPFPVADSMAHSTTPAEFELEYFVSEDVLPDGIEGEILDMTFDAAGRCWVSLTQDYPNDAGAGNDSIVICEDTDGDGVADEFTVFREGLSIPHSLIPHEDGVMVAEVGTDESGRVVYLGDEDGDDVADVEETIFTGYGTDDTHAGLNQLYRGLDNWIYGVVGYAGLTPSIDEDLSFSQDVFRFRPDGSEIEFVGTGASNMAGVKTNEEGLVFCSSATAGNNVTSYAAIPAAYYDYINGYDGTTTVDIRSETNFSRTDNENRILPINNRYRQVDFHGGFTAATDQEIYTAREFPEQYWNSTTFVSDGTGQLTSTYYLEQDGAGYESIYHHNLFASNDEWSSPTYVNTGPDGMVWLIDMYDFVFQHNPTPEGYENGPGNAYESGVRDTQHSRLYRVTTGDVDLQPMDLSDASASELVDALGEDNMFWRKIAQRKLIEQDATDAVDDLVSLATTENLDDIGLDVAAIHALWTLEGLDAVTDNADALRDALTHSSAGVRLNALRVLPPTAATRDAILEHDLLNDPDGRVQMWALLTLAETPESQAAGEAVFEMIDDEANLQEELLVEAASIAGATHASGFLSLYASTYGDPSLREGVNQLSNSDFEEVDIASPDGWSGTVYGGDGELTYSTDEANSGDRSVRIDAEEGTDASWNTTVSVQPNTEYTLSGYIKTEDVQLVDGTGFSDVTPFGAVLNVDQVGGASDADLVTDPLTGTNDWTEVSVTLNSGDNEELTVNCLFGGFGEATGTAWYDDLSLVGPDGTNLLPTPGFEAGTTVDRPADWDDATAAGTGAFAADESVAQSGEYSVRIASDDGVDGSWSQTVSVEPNSEYTLVGWVRTDGVAAGAGSGARLEIDELGTDATTDAVTGTQDWTEVSATFDSGDNGELTVAAVLGGFGASSGTAWFDGVALYDPDAEDTSYSENLLPNPSFESGDGNDVDGWGTDLYSGTVDEHFRTDQVSYAGDYSVGITATAEEGADAAWSILGYQFEQGEQYVFNGQIKTENVEALDGAGAVVYIFMGDGSVTSEPLTGTNDWTEIELEFEATQASGNIHLMQGLGGAATGTTWFDDVSLVRVLSEDDPLADVYQRVATHQEQASGPTAEFAASSTSTAVGETVTFDASASSSPGGSITGYEWAFGDDTTATGESVSHAYDSAGEYTVTLTVTDDTGATDTASTTVSVTERAGLDPATTLEFDGYTDGWEATAPDAIVGETNPTLSLREGEEYTVEFTNQDGAPHDFAIEDGSGTVVADSGDYVTEVGGTDSLTFTVDAAMDTYVCTAHPQMVGNIDVV
ncbi:PVC-type heme-binding CxxCH protein [Halomicrobium salinisoli]|uniref:PVC-type heme-binding CxxCH protein n=1 Tax=Halomicrobium salinisoli TaxID=2878391 RepID=UPI001CEFF91D|nr:PVC-type heme-binding CxxCH protein [Halomicrobium salinisoli]